MIGFDIIFFKMRFSENSVRNTISVYKSLDQDQARYFVCPDPGPNCRQRFSADNPCRQRVNEQNM